MKFISAAIDVETTGLKAGLNEIIQLSIVTFDEVSFTPSKEFNTLVRPMHIEYLDNQALEINGLDKRDLEEAPTPLQVKSAFDQWHEEALDERMIFPLGHNYSFDQIFLKYFFSDELYNSKFHYQFRDSQKLAISLKDAKILPNDLEVKLVDLVDYFNLSTGYKKPHNSLEDCKFTILIYKELINLIN